MHESTSKSASRAPRHTPGCGIADCVDLDGSRGLERLPGAPFFSEVHVVNFRKTSFLPEKKTPLRGTPPANNKGFLPGVVFLPGKNVPARQATCRTTGAGGRQAGGRREAKIRVFPKMPPEPPGVSGGLRLNPSERSFWSRDPYRTRSQNAFNLPCRLCIPSVCVHGFPQSLARQPQSLAWQPPSLARQPQSLA